MVWGSGENGKNNKNRDEKGAGMNSSGNTGGPSGRSFGDLAAGDLDAEGPISENDGGPILTARGTSAGLVLRAHGRANKDVLWESLRSFIQSRRNFVEGNQVIIEWVDDVPSNETISFVRSNILRDFDIDLVDGGRVAGGFDEMPAGNNRASAMNRGVDRDNVDRGLEFTPLSSSSSYSYSGSSYSDPAAESGSKGRMPSLFDGIEAAIGKREDSTRNDAGAASRSSGAKLGATPKVGWGAALANWDDADARVVYGTLRSGQKIETEHSVVVFGDVNSGAEIVAGGDVVVLGNLRGVAHAGAYDETGGGRVIFALHLEPTQLRIGAVISRGMGGGSTPEIARVDGQMIIVEPYQAKGAPTGRKAA